MVNTVDNVLLLQSLDGPLDQAFVALLSEADQLLGPQFFELSLYF